MRNTTIEAELSSSVIQPAADFGGDVRRAILAPFRSLITILDVARERRQLAGLDDRMLKDIGLSRSLADREASRSLLDVPQIREHMPRF